MSCNCDYSVLVTTPCSYCMTTTAPADITQKRIWRQVRAASSSYVMNLSALTSGAAILASQSNTNWNQMSDRVVASQQKTNSPTHGNSLRTTLTSGRPGASTPGGAGVDVKHDSYARYLNRKKAGVLKTQTSNLASVPVQGNKINQVGLLANSIKCCA